MDFFKELIPINYQNNMGISSTDEFFCVYIESLFEQGDSSLLIVLDTLYEANNVYASLSKLNDYCYLFPMDDFLTSEAIAISPDLLVNRLDTLQALVESEDKKIIVTNLMGYLRYLPSKKCYKNSILHYQKGDLIEPNDLVQNLVLLGYTRDSIVNKTGEFASRGFILDIYPFHYDKPVRIEFFDNEIESIRLFDPDNQKSISTISEVTIVPFFEFITNTSVSSEFFGKQKYLPNFGEISSLSQYLNSFITIFKNRSSIDNEYHKILDQVSEYREEKDQKFSGNYFYLLEEVFLDKVIYYQTISNVFLDSSIIPIHFNVFSAPLFYENIDDIKHFISQSLRDGKTILICLKKYQLESVMKKLSISSSITTFDKIDNNFVNFVNVEMSKGFIYENYIILTEYELFIHRDNKRTYDNKFKYSTSINELSKLSIGDYVVHNVHGIGRYDGIKSLTFHDITKDYLVVVYQGDDKIYIPVEKIHLISKYSSHDGGAPKLNKLGSVEWKKTKARIRHKIQDMTDKLLNLYAERESLRGYAFSEDNYLNTEFEKDFPYELTKDQVKAIQQIKKDMESSVPMDRLLCGDVGFGKTEVAFVAAFKAILDSKQVLFLCPTTILSSQHYENALIRFQNFPIRIALLNRFTTSSKTKEILEGLSNGSVNMVIGTHRLLSNDIICKDLGLLIIDEEQRFGVAHKERLKELKVNVDVLTLSATPIPRTLQMSLTGIRSLSLIETPPVNRYPIQTYVVEESKQIIKDAIYKELSRGGQIYYLYNRVDSIEEEYYRLSQLVPETRITIAHGQLSKNDLEDRISAFIRKEYDLLLCTTIIETGMDISNVNTLIIIDADRFGLSQLYQIRGRVGRSDRFAYAYLMYKPFKVLSDASVKRLSVIREFTELGSGFAIAARDLSIRGAGDILGKEQAGFIDSVGIDLYLKMLNDAVNAKKDNLDEEDEISSDSDKPLLEVSTHIDDFYVSEDELKIEIHQKINSIDSSEKLIEVKEELQDRFGNISDDLLIYMYEEWFEKLAKKIPVSKVLQSKNSIELYFEENAFTNISMDELFIESYNISRMFRFLSKSKYIVIVLDLPKLEKHPIYYLVDLLQCIERMKVICQS